MAGHTTASLCVENSIETISPHGDGARPWVANVARSTPLPSPLPSIQKFHQPHPARATSSTRGPNRWPWAESSSSRLISTVRPARTARITARPRQTVGAPSAPPPDPPPRRRGRDSAMGGTEIGGEGPITPHPAAAVKAPLPGPVARDPQRDSSQDRPPGRPRRHRQPHNNHGRLAVKKWIVFPAQPRSPASRLPPRAPLMGKNRVLTGENNDSLGKS